MKCKLIFNKIVGKIANEYFVLFNFKINQNDHNSIKKKNIIIRTPSYQILRQIIEKRRRSLPGIQNFNNVTL